MTKVGQTGSRFFGSAGPRSDHDFYTQDSPEARAQLLAEGFRPLRKTGVCGPNIVAIYRSGVAPNNVDIALCASFDRKHQENRLMTITPFRLINRFAPKRIRTKLWGLVQKL